MGYRRYDEKKKNRTRATLAVCRKILRLAHARAMRYPTVVGHRLLDHARPIYYQTHRARALCYLLGLLRPRHFGFESPHEPGTFAVPHPNSVPPTTTATETTSAKAMPTQKTSFSLGIITYALKKTKTRCRFLNSTNKKIRSPLRMVWRQNSATDEDQFKSGGTARILPATKAQNGRRHRLFGIPKIIIVPDFPGAKWDVAPRLSRGRIQNDGSALAGGHLISSNFPV